MGSETLDDVFDQYIAKALPDLSPTTQRDYLGFINGRKAGDTGVLRLVFGESLPDDIEPTHIAQFLRMRAENGAAVTGNRERSCLSSVFNFAMRMGLASRNPCHGVKRNPEKPKTRYVRNDEYLAAFEAAEEYVQDLMAVIYLMGLRPNEARSLKRQQITPKGIRWEESKTGKVKIISWTPALQFFITRACSRCESDYVLTNSLGRRWTEWGMHSALRRIRARVDGPTWTWHDLRAKAESDSAEGMGLLPLYKRAVRIKPVV
jgi:integrase